VHLRHLGRFDKPPHFSNFSLSRDCNTQNEYFLFRWVTRGSLVGKPRIVRDLSPDDPPIPALATLIFGTVIWPISPATSGDATVAQNCEADLSNSEFEIPKSEVQFPKSKLGLLPSPFHPRPRPRPFRLLIPAHILKLEGRQNVR